MTTTDREDFSKECVLDLDTALSTGSLELETYVEESTRRLDAIARLATRGELVDRESREWMLNQVDFIVETIGQEGLELDDELRSNLLQFLLSIANLNEHIRHQNALNL